MVRKMRLLTTLAVEVAFKRRVLPDWHADHDDIEVVWAPTNVLMEKIRGGERGDVVILIDKPMAELAGGGIVAADSIVPIAQAKFGLGVKAGAKIPDISTPDAFVEALRSGGRIAYSLTGASGQYFLTLLDRLGIADEVLPRAVSIPAGFTGEKLLDGEADMAVQQVSELMSVQGVDVVGPFPDPLQQPTDFSAAMFAEAENPALAREFLLHLTSRKAHEAYEAGGLASRITS